MLDTVILTLPLVQDSPAEGGGSGQHLFHHLCPPHQVETEQSFSFIFYLFLPQRYVRVCFSLYPEFSNLLHNDPAAHQDHCGKCRIRTRNLCP